MAEVSDYTALVPSANAKAVNFIAALSAMVQPFVDQINLCESMPALFDIDSALGDQQDIIGEWINLSRQLAAPIANLYFSFDDDTVGLDQGIWFNSSMPITGIVVLDDITFRQFLRLKIRANVWDGSLGAANQALVDIFGSQGDPPVVWITDNFDMTLTNHITADPHSALLEELVLGGYLPFRPAGVAHT